MHRDFVQLPELIVAARDATLPFEAASTGRWVRFADAGNSAYVVRFDHTNSYVVVTMGAAGDAQIRQFREPRDAVAAAVYLVGRKEDQ